MSNTIYTKPFTQIVEDVMLECREASSADSTVRAKYKRRVNDVYTRGIPSRHEFDWLKKKGNFTLKASYATGTVAISAGGTTLTGTSTVWTAALDGMKIWIGSNPEVYIFTYVSGTSGTISPAYTGLTSETAATYCIFETTYALPADYDSLTSEPGLWFEQGRGRTTLTWYPEHIHMRSVTSQTSQYPSWFRENTELSSLYFRQLDVIPPVTAARVISFEYFKTFPEMTEFTTGTASTTINSITVTLSADQSASVSVGQYFRTNPSEFGGESQWSKITGVSGATLTVFPSRNATVSSGSYTISDVPQYPPHMIQSIFLGACLATGIEQNDKFLFSGFQSLFENSLGLGMRREARKRYGKKTMRLDYKDNRREMRY